MKAFGLELRRANTIANLYEEVDATLARAGMADGCVSESMSRDTIAHALQDMISRSRHFSVCTIDTCANVWGLVIPKERVNIYRAAHCIDYADMTEEYRRRLIAMVLDDFRCVLNPEGNEV